MLQLDEFKRQVRLELVDDEDRPAVAGIHDDFELMQAPAIDIAQEVFKITLGGVERGRAAGLRRRRRQTAASDQGAHLGQSGIAADWPRSLAHELHAVVVGRVVARGNHDATVKPVGEGRKIHAFSAAQADVAHLATAIHEPAAQGVCKRCARQPDVAPDGDDFWLDESGIGTPDVVSERLVQLGGNAAANVIGLKGGKIHRGGLSRYCLRARSDPGSARCRLRPDTIRTALR